MIVFNQGWKFQLKFNRKCYIFLPKEWFFIITNHIITFRLVICCDFYWNMADCSSRQSQISQQETWEGFVLSRTSLFLGGFRPTREIALICTRHIAGEGLHTALMAIEQWGIFNVPHLLWYGPTLYNGHLRAERLAVTLSLPVLSRPRIESRPPSCEANSFPLRHSGGRVDWILIDLERDYNKTTVKTLWCCPYFSADCQKNI